MSGTAAVERPHHLRSDAWRNRERIIAAARETFVEQGPDVALDAIAHRAGVGNATLYRHFNGRSELVHWVVLSSTNRVTELAEAALAEEPDPFEGLQRFVHQAADERIGALSCYLSKEVDTAAPDMVAARRRFEDAVNALMANARRSGQLRPDVEIGDLMTMIVQLTRPFAGTACVDFDRFVHRHLQLFLDGLHHPPRSVLPGAPITPEDFGVAAS